MKLLLTLMTAATLFAQPSTTPGGHWEGAISTPNGDLAIQVELAPDGKAGWMGTISIPAQRATDLPLVAVGVKGAEVRFAIAAPGDPQFVGSLAGAKIDGELTQGGGTMQFHLTRTGEAKIEKPVPNPVLSADLAGTWEGVLQTGGQQLRLRFVFANQGGGGTGKIFSLDQNNAEIPIATISRDATHVKLRVPMIAGSFDGQLKDATLTGTWTQAGADLPLTLKKAAK